MRWAATEPSFVITNRRDAHTCFGLQQNHLRTNRMDAHTCVGLQQSHRSLELIRRNAHTCLRPQRFVVHLLEIVQGTHTRVLGSYGGIVPLFEIIEEPYGHTLIGLQQSHCSLERIEGTHTRVLGCNSGIIRLLEIIQGTHTCFRLQQWHHSFVRNNTGDAHTCLRQQRFVVRLL